MGKSSALRRRLERSGWYVLRQGRGSHVIFVHPQKPGIEIVFPDHGRAEIGKGLESKILKLAGLK